MLHSSAGGEGTSYDSSAVTVTVLQCYTSVLVEKGPAMIVVLLLLQCYTVVLVEKGTVLLLVYSRAANASNTVTV